MKNNRCFRRQTASIELSAERRMNIGPIMQTFWQSAELLLLKFSFCNGYAFLFPLFHFVVS